MPKKLTDEERKIHVKASRDKYNRTEIRKQKQHQYYLNKVVIISEKAKAKRKFKRNLILDHYGRQCACCGERHEEFLGIDHIYGGGRQHKLRVQNKLYDWLITNNYPEGFRILCHNCNQSLGTYGYCPHQKELNL